MKCPHITTIDTDQGKAEAVCAGELKRHCPEANTMCTWHRCTRCKARLDVKRGRGFVDGAHPDRFTFAVGT